MNNFGGNMSIFPWFDTGGTGAVSTTGASSTTIDPATPDPSLIEFPEAINVNQYEHVSAAAGIISKHCLVENIDYIKRLFHDRYSGQITIYRFKDATYVSEIRKEMHRIDYIIHS